MTKIPTYTTSATEGEPQLDYVFSDGNLVTVLFGRPELAAMYMNEGQGGSLYVADLTDLYEMQSKALHTTHTIMGRNEDGTPYYETYVINESIPPRFEETND